MDTVFSERTYQINKKHFFNIEFLRIIFTSLVVISHTTSMLKLPSAAGGYAVEFFFVLSGFFLTYTFNENVSIGQIMLKKYIMWTPLIVFGGMLVEAKWSAFYGLFYLQNTGLAAYADISNAPAWYLAVLFWVSLFYITLIKTVDEGIRNVVVGCILFVIVILIQQNPTGGRLDRVFSLFPIGLLRGVVDVGLGYYVATYFKSTTDETSSKKIFCWSIVEIILLIWILISSFYSEWRSTTRICVPVAMSVLIYSFIKQNGLLSQVFNRSIFVKLAKPCLATYLTHWAIIQNLLPLMIDKGMVLKYCHLEIIIFILVISWLLGVFSCLIIEKPCNKFLLKKFIHINR